MNFIMNKIRNFLNFQKVDKLMFIYMNEKTFNRLIETRKKLQFVEIEIDENDFCEMKNNLLQIEISLHKTTSLFTLSFFKQSINQSLKYSAKKTWPKKWNCWNWIEVELMIKKIFSICMWIAAKIKYFWSLSPRIFPFFPSVHFFFENFTLQTIAI